MVYEFEKLRVWQDAMKLSKRIYLVTRNFPNDEKYGMVSQIRRAVVSVALNIAEGKGRHYDKVFLQFLYQARGSIYEVITLVRLSCDLGYLSDENVRNLLVDCDEVSSKLGGLIKSINEST